GPAPRRRPRSRLPDVERLGVPPPGGGGGHRPGLGRASSGSHLAGHGPTADRGYGPSGDPGFYRRCWAKKSMSRVPASAAADSLKFSEPSRKNPWPASG